jgi:hypothetical protein
VVSSEPLLDFSIRYACSPSSILPKATSSSMSVSVKKLIPGGSISSRALTPISPASWHHADISSLRAGLGTVMVANFAQAGFAPARTEKLFPAHETPTFQRRAAKHAWGALMHAVEVKKNQFCCLDLFEHRHFFEYR